MSESIMQSLFTQAALETLFPDWEAYPEHARRISMARLGEHTTATPIDWTDTDVYEPLQDFEDVGVTVGETSDPTVAKITVSVEAPAAGSPLRGKTIKEIGLFIDNRAAGAASPDWVMVWVSDMPGMYVPTVEESGGITISFIITVPIRFDNVDQISLLTDNTSLATRIGEAESAINSLESETDDLREAVGDLATGKADVSDLEALQTLTGSRPAGVPSTSDLWSYVTAMNGNQGGATPLAAAPKANQALVGNRPTEGTLPTDSTLWDFVKVLNDGSGTASSPRPKADQTLVGDRPTGVSGNPALWEFVKVLNDGSGTASSPRQKADLFSFNAQITNCDTVTFNSPAFLNPWVYFLITPNTTGVGMTTPQPSLFLHGTWYKLALPQESVQLDGYAGINLVLSVGLQQYNTSHAPSIETLAHVTFMTSQLLSPYYEESTGYSWPRTLGGCTAVSSGYKVSIVLNSSGIYFKLYLSDPGVPVAFTYVHGVFHGILA